MKIRLLYIDVNCNLFLFYGGGLCNLLKKNKKKQKKNQREIARFVTLYIELEPVSGN